jgi:hypothetical protein
MTAQIYWSQLQYYKAQTGDGKTRAAKLIIRTLNYAISAADDVLRRQ